ncbi:MAG TPA: endonuclease/exonuclease/phosphatase family protein [Nitriliruptorales bacterium]|nr:endonuclease/exonuclease/phosphatase family protein [Nitriliruptorales bacterium]
MIRVAAYNVCGVLDAGALVEVLRHLDADVVAAVEVPGRLGLRRIASRAGMDVAVHAGRRRLGAAVLVGERIRVVSASRHELREAPGLPRRWVAQAIVGAGGVRFAVFAAQLGLRPEVRERHAAELERVAAKVDAAVLLGVDLNEAAGGMVAARLGEVLQDAFAVAGQGPGDTYPNPHPITRKDYVFVDRGLAVLRAWVPDLPAASVASHHRPVVAEIAEPVEQPTARRLREDAA